MRNSDADIAIDVLAAADQAEPASAKASGYQDRMRVEYRDLTARAGRLRDMLQRYADGTLDFEPTCPISLLSRQLDVMDEYALILRRRANIEHIGLGEQRIDTATRDARWATQPTVSALPSKASRACRTRSPNQCASLAKPSLKSAA